MNILVPFDVQTPKTRLKKQLSSEERQAFARALLRDVTTAVVEAGHTPELLATGPVETQHAVTIKEEPLTGAVNTVLQQRSPPTAVLMADLGLATPHAINRMFKPTADVVLVPGRSGGTNAFLTRHPEFYVNYHGGSLRDHRRIANRIGASVVEIDSFRLATDIDDPADLIEVLLHTNGAASQWLKENGFRLDSDAGELQLVRSQK